jgi:hypothetical protein
MDGTRPIVSGIVAWQRFEGIHKSVEKQENV